MDRNRPSTNPHDYKANLLVLGVVVVVRPRREARPEACAVCVEGLVASVVVVLEVDVVLGEFPAA